MIPRKSDQVLDNWFAPSQNNLPNCSHGGTLQANMSLKHPVLPFIARNKFHILGPSVHAPLIPLSNIKTVFPGIDIPIIPILVGWLLYTEPVPCSYAT